MTHLKNYTHFGGRHSETGVLHNALAFEAKSADKAPSEAMLMGISGGAAFGYFLFDYTGYPPLLSLLARNTFDPFETLLTRLAVPCEVMQTVNPAKAEASLIELLQGGQPVIVWADRFTLPYHNKAASAELWDIQPVLVIGFDAAQRQVHIADCAAAPFTVDADVFAQARARIGKHKHRAMTVRAPDSARFKGAVRQGLWQCAQLFTERPPKGAANNFGFAAYRHWAEMLSNTRNPKSWVRFFPNGPRLYSALAGNVFNPGLIGWVCTHGAGDGMERGVYADFLDEAAALLKAPKLRLAASLFRASREAWNALAQIALPDEVPLLRETRELKLERHAIYIEKAGAGLNDLVRIDTRLREIEATCAATMPVSDAQVTAMFAAMRTQVLRIHDIEFEAVNAIKSALG